MSVGVIPDENGMYVSEHVNDMNTYTSVAVIKYVLAELHEQHFTRSVHFNLPSLVGLS